MATAVVPSHPFRLLVALDLGETSGHALDEAAMIAARIPGAHLHVVHVLDEGEAPHARVRADQIALYLDEKAAALGIPRTGVSFAIHVVSGDVAHAIVDVAEGYEVDLVLLGRRKGPHLGRGIAAKVTDEVRCPVVIAGPKPHAKPAGEPQIEPPCPDCVARRDETHGREIWCARHAHAEVAGHTYGYSREIPMTTHDSNVIPTGVRF